MKLILLNSVLLLTLFGCNEDFQVATLKDPTNCAEYKARFPSAANGSYSLNLDGNELTPHQLVHCDFTGGNWTTLIGPSITAASDLTEFGDTSDIASTFYSDPVLGIGWGGLAVTGGPNPVASQQQCFTFSKIKSISEVKISVTWDGLGSANGYMYVGNEIDPARYAGGGFDTIQSEEGLLTSLNAWSGNPAGRNRVVLHNPAPTPDVTVADFNGNAAGEVVTITHAYSSAGKFQICMSGQDPYVYDRRFVQSLSFK